MDPLNAIQHSAQTGSAEDVYKNVLQGTASPPAVLNARGEVEAANSAWRRLASLLPASSGRCSISDPVLQALDAATGQKAEGGLCDSLQPIISGGARRYAEEIALTVSGEDKIFL